MFSSSYLQKTLNFKASSSHVNGGILSDNMSPLSKNDLHRIFEQLDKNGDGSVSLDDLNWLVQRIGPVQFSLEELEPLVGKPCLNFDEFLFFYDSILEPTATSDPRPTSSDAKVEEEEESVVHDGDRDLAKAFKVFDLNGDGFISCEELEAVLGRLGLWDESSGKDCRTMICFYDTNMDGMVDFQEFKHMMFHSSS